MATLYINPSSSRCGKCNRNADPKETHHEMLGMVGTGCGAEFTSVSSDYSDFEGLYDRVRAMRPDLEFVSWLTEKGE